MKKIIALFCIVACTASLLVGCSGKKMSFADFYANYTYTDEYPTLKSNNKLSDLSELNYQSATEEIVVFTNKDNKKLKFYNALSESVVLNLDKDYVSGYKTVSVSDATFILVVEKDENKTDVYYTNLYDAKGNLVATKNEYTDSYYLAELVTGSLDLIRFNGCIYRVNGDGTTSLIVSNPFFGDIPSLDFKTEKYYYEVGSDEVTVYSHELAEVFHWASPLQGSELCVNVTSDECIFVQMLERLPDTEKKYDVLMNGGKFNLISTMIDVETGKEKDLDLDYFTVNEFVFARNRIYKGSESFDMVPKDIDNIAFVYEIEDKRISTSIDDMKCVSLNGKNAKIKCELFPEFDNMPSPLVNGRFEYYSNSGNMTLVDAEGRFIGRIDNLKNGDAEYNESYIVTDGKIYNFDLKVAYDYTAEGKQLVNLLGHGVLLKDKDNYYVYTRNGNLVTLEGNVITYACTKQLIVSYSGGKYLFHDEDGGVIASFEAASVNLIFSDNANGICIVAITASGETNYYKFTK